MSIWGGLGTNNLGTQSGVTNFMSCVAAKASIGKMLNNRNCKLEIKDCIVMLYYKNGAQRGDSQ